MESGVGTFIRELYELGGFKSWGEYSREVGTLPATISDYKTGKHAPSGRNLLRLIHAATDRAPLAMREAAERTSPLAQVRSHLQVFGEEAERGRQAVIASLTSIDVRLAQIEARLDAQDEQDQAANP